MSDTIEVIEARRAARREATAAAREAQYKIDLAALDALEEEHGDTQVVALHADAYVKGLPTMIVVKSPGGTSYHKRFCDQVRAAKENAAAIGAAQDMLARASIVYPTDATAMAAMFEAFPNMLNDAAAAAVGFVKLKSEAEKKG